MILPIDQYYYPGTRVIVNEIEGERHGVVVSYRGTNMAELQPPIPVSKDPEDPPITWDPLFPPNFQRRINMYLILIDGEETPREFYKFIRLEIVNETNI
jgi:hypothetical protein